MSWQETKIRELSKQLHQAQADVKEARKVAEQIRDSCVEADIGPVGLKGKWLLPWELHDEEAER